MIKHNIQPPSNTVEQNNLADADIADDLEQKNLNYTRPRYDLNPEELKLLESELVESVKAAGLTGQVVATWISPRHKFANVIRNYEAKYFPEVADLDDTTEDETLFLALVDTREGSDRVVHAATISSGTALNNPEARSDDRHGDEEHTGFYSIDDLIDMGNFTKEEFVDYYTSRGIDLSKCIAVETIFRIGDKVKGFNGLRIADLTYLMIMKMFMAGQPEINKSGIFANINRATAISFKWAKLNYQPLMGRRDLKTSDSLRGLDFTPIIIPFDDNNHPIFEKIETAIPELSF
jgi:hypothetical protein